ncbi:MAG: hypothetical protein WC895_04145 [Candidatus Shapirobacteria bacterium]|jgi:hypothetical protein
MQPSQFIGYMLLQTTAITSIVGVKIYSGNRPATTLTPCINFYELSGGNKKYGIWTESYSINCRDSTQEKAKILARLVDDLFNGTSGTGIYGSVTGFSVIQSSSKGLRGCIPESDSNIYNAPVDIQLVFANNTIS